MMLGERAVLRGRTTLHGDVRRKNHKWNRERALLQCMASLTSDDRAGAAARAETLRRLGDESSGGSETAGS